MRRPSGRRPFSLADLTPSAAPATVIGRTHVRQPSTGGRMLTDRQREIYDYVARYVDDHGYPPTSPVARPPRAPRRPPARSARRSALLRPPPCTRPSPISSAPA